MPIFDSHTHLNHPDFAGREDELWREAQEAGVTAAVVIGYDLESSRKALEIAERHPGLYASVGVSPHDYAKAPEGYLQELETLAQHPRVVAIGEAGLEYYYPASPKEFQREHFVRQIELANRLRKTLVVHLRDADEDFLQIMQAAQPHRMILHCFTASIPLMEQAVRNGHYISFSGIVTFKSAQNVQEAAAQVPPERLLIETDAPYLAPVPHRGKPCRPGMIVDTARFVAGLRGEDFDAFCAQTCRNAGRAFGLESTGIGEEVLR
jgi:TatD DNase family protein